MQLCSASITNAHTLRFENLLDGFGDLGGEFLLDLQPTGEPVHHPRQLSDAHHPVSRQVSDMRATDHREHVMLAKADYADVLQHHQLVVTADFLKGALQIVAGLLRRKLNPNILMVQSPENWHGIGGMHPTA